MPLVFTPPAEDDIIQRFRADQTVVDGGGRVTQWTDISANDNHATLLGASVGPLLIASSGMFAGQPALDFRRLNVADQLRTLLAVDPLYAAGYGSYGPNGKNYDGPYSVGIVFAIAYHSVATQLGVALSAAKSDGGSGWASDPSTEFTFYPAPTSPSTMPRTAVSQWLLKPFNTTGGVLFNGMTGTAVAAETLLDSLTIIPADPNRANATMRWGGVTYNETSANTGADIVYSHIAIGNLAYATQNAYGQNIYIAEIVRWNKELTVGEATTWADYVNTRYILGLADPPPNPGILVHGAPAHRPQLSHGAFRGVPQLTAQTPSHKPQLSHGAPVTRQE